MADERDVMEAPARRMVDRGAKTLEAVLRQSGPAGVGALQTSTNEISFLMQATRLAVDALGARLDDTEQALHKARLRGLTRAIELRKAAEPCLETGQVCELLGVSRETVRKKVDRKHLLALPKGADRVFPAFQFKEGDMVPGLGEVLVALEAQPKP